jgi:hypothetical protein
MLAFFREQTFLDDMMQKQERILNNNFKYFRADDRTFAKISSSFHFGMSF